MKTFAILVPLSLLASLALPAVTGQLTGDNTVQLLLTLCLLGGGAGGMGGLQGIAPLLLLTQGGLGSGGDGLLGGSLGTILLLSSLTQGGGPFGGPNMGYSAGTAGYGHAVPAMYPNMAMGMESPDMYMF